MAELGARAGSFATDNRKRLRISICCLAVGVVAVGVGLWFIIEISYVIGPRTPGGPPNTGPIPAGLVVLGLVGIVFGALLLVTGLRHRGESFELYERGLIHRTSGGTRMIPWADIASVRVSDATRPDGNAALPNTWLKRLLGAEVVCVLRLRDGGRLRFDAYTADASTLAARVGAAVDKGQPPRPA